MFFRRSDPAVSVQRSLLEVAAQYENDLPSTSSFGPVSPYYVNGELRESLVLPFQILGMIKITESKKVLKII